MLFVTTSSVFVSVKPGWANQSISEEKDVPTINTVERVLLSESGHARLNIQTDVNDGPVADLYRRMLAAPSGAGVNEVMPIPESRSSKIQPGAVSPVKSTFYKGIKEEQLYSYGFTTKIFNSSMMPISSTGSFSYSIDASALPQITNIIGLGETNIWRIHLGPKDDIALRRTVGFDLTEAAFARAMLNSQKSEQQYNSYLTMTIVLPQGSNLINMNDLDGLNWTVNFGGGTFKTASVQVSTPPTITLTEEFIVTEENFTATPDELCKALCTYGTFDIVYSLPKWAASSPETNQGLLDVSGDDFSYPWALPPWSSETTIPFDFGPVHLDLTVNVNLTLAGFIGFDFGWIQHDWYGIPYWLYEPLWFETWVSPQASVSVTFNATASREYSKEWTHDLFSFSEPEFFNIGPIPVELNLTLSCMAKVNFTAQANVSLEAEAHASLSFKAGLRWDRDSSWSNIWEQSMSSGHTGPDITIEANASACAGVGLRFGMLFYETVGPFVEFWLIAKGVITILPVLSWDLSLHFEIDVGISFGSWLKTLIGLDDHKWTIYDLEISDWGGHVGVVSSEISVNAKPSTTSPGSPFTIYGSISSEYPGNKSGIVEIQYSTDNAVWNYLGSSSSDELGYYTYNGTLYSEGKYYIRSSWDGNPGYYGATAPSFYPLKIQNTIPLIGCFHMISVFPNSTSVGQTVLVRSQITFQVVGLPILSVSFGTTTLQWSSDGTLWHSIASGQPSSGIYDCNWAPPSVGKYLLRSTWEGQLIVMDFETVSSVVLLEVTRANTSLDIYLSTSSMEYGNNATVTTSMSPLVNGKTVKLEYSFDNSTWYFLSLGNTDSTGQYTFTWKPMIGEYYIRSMWTGDENYLGSESTTRSLSVIEPSQYSLTVISPYNTVSGMGLYDVNTTAYAMLSGDTFDIIPGSVRAVFTGWAGDANGTGLTSDPMVMDDFKTAVATWKIQFHLSVVTDPVGLPEIPGATWYDNYTKVKLEAPQYTPSIEGIMGVRYGFDYWEVDGVTRDSGISVLDLNMDMDHVATAQYTLQYEVTFFETSVGSDFNGTLATIDTTDYSLHDFPLTFWFNNGTSHDFAFHSPLPSESGTRYYIWSFSNGLSTQQSGSIVIIGPGSVTGNYVLGGHDVSVENVVPGCDWPYPGKLLNVNVTIMNHGDFNETVTLTIYFNITSNDLIGSQTIDVSPKESRTLAFVWNTTGIPTYHNYTLTAVAEIPVDENLTNNVMNGQECVEIRIFGDMNGDHCVDMRDIGPVAYAFGSFPGHSRWNKNYDVNQDGKVNLVDVALVSRRFGTKLEP
jgi:hypothetical protein